MSHEVPSPTEITYRVLEELEAFQGIYWRAVRGEFHGAYDEVAIWILLKEAGDLARAHRRFRDVVSSRFYLAHFTVSYLVATPDGEMLLECLVDNDAIERAGASCPLGARPPSMRAGSSLFRIAAGPETPRRRVH
jgi:hypothetical protein